MLWSTWSACAFAALLVWRGGPALASNSTAPAESCASLYRRGVEAYLENGFGDCVAHLEAAVEAYRGYTKKVQNCRLACAEEAERAEPLYPVDVEDLRFYEKAVRNTLCLIRCQKKSDVFALHLDRETSQVFEDRKPYEYLHICYFQVKRSR